MASTVSFTTFHNIIDGKPRDSKTSYQSINPANGEKLWDVPIATKEDVDDAVKSARTAFKTWSKIPFDERAALLKKFGEALKPYLADFSEILMKENGKPVCFHLIEREESVFPWWNSIFVPLIQIFEIQCLLMLKCS